jgi:ribosomal protein S6
MSRKYEGLIVLNPKNIDGTIDDTIKAVSKEIEGEGVKVEKVHQIGRRQFAYASRHVEAGHFVNYTFSGSPETIKKIQARLTLNGNVHLQHYKRIA